MTRFVGIDFGTTNSAIAIAESGAPPKLVTLGLAERAREIFA